MRCPSCRGLLVEESRAGVDVDLCPGCGAIWFDHAELRKFVPGDRADLAADAFLVHEGSEFSCPRCDDGPLETGAIGPLVGHRCAGCLGILLRRADLEPLMGRSLARRLADGGEAAIDLIDGLDAGELTLEAAMALGRGASALAGFLRDLLTDF